MNDNMIYTELRVLHDINNPVLIALFEEAIKDILDKVKESPECAVEAHYEYLAIKRVLNKLTNLEYKINIEEQG